MSALYETVREKLFKLADGVVETTTNPSSMKNIIFSGGSFEAVNRFEIDQNNVWINGDGTQLLEFYSKARISTYLNQFIRERNCVNYFWAKSASSFNYKRTHGNIAHTIVRTLTNITNVPKIYTTNLDYEKLTNDIVEENELYELYDKQVFYTLGEGWGAFRIDIDTVNQIVPRIKYFRASNTFYVKKDGDIIGIVYLTNYLDSKNKEYTLVETRYVFRKTLENGKKVPYSCIDRECYKIENGDAKFIPLAECDFIADKESHYEFENIPFILGEFSQFYDLDGFENQGLYGRSVFYGKIDNLDDYDQALSVASTSIRRSSPKVIYPVESLQTTRSGVAKTPEEFDTEYLAVPNQLSGDGMSMESATPKVVQPQIQLNIYKDMMEESMKAICGGLISLNDLGLNEQTFFRDSAEAIRERSRQTIYTVNTIRKREQKALKSLVNKSIFLYEYFWKNKTNIDSKQIFENTNINIRYDKFLSPSTEQKVKVYLPMFQSGAISTSKFVHKVYEDEMDETEMEREIEQLNEMRYRQDEGQINFANEVPEFEKTSSPYKDGTTTISDNSGMNNNNRAKKAIDSI